MGNKKEKIHVDVQLIRARILLGRFDRRLAFVEGERKEELEKARTELDATLTEAEMQIRLTPVDWIMQTCGALLCWVCSALGITKINRPHDWLFYTLMGVGAVVFSLSIYSIHKRRVQTGKALRDTCRRVGPVIQPDPETGDASLVGPPVEIPTAWKVFADRSFLAPGLKFKKQLSNTRTLFDELVASDEAIDSPGRDTVEAQEDLRDLLEQMERGRRFSPLELGQTIAGIVFVLLGVILIAVLPSSITQTFGALVPMVVGLGSGLLSGALAAVHERRKRLLVLLREGCGEAVRVLLAERGD